MEMAQLFAAAIAAAFGGWPARFSDGRRDQQVFFLEPPDIYFVQPERFISLAAGSGLKHLQHFRRQEPGGPSRTRFEYLFRKG
jgi:hypothetical protein